MMHHMTQRCALIRIYRRCYAMDKNAVLLSRPGFVLVIYVCMHSSSKVCRRLPRVLEACAWSAVHAHASSVDGPQNTINGRF